MGLFKIRVKEFSIAFGISKLNAERISVKNLNIYWTLDKQLAVHSDTSLYQKRKEIKQKLDEYYINKSKGYQIRSRAKWVEEGEQSTKYLHILILTQSLIQYLCFPILTHV